MPDSNVKSFMLLNDTLEKMAEGVKMHSGEPNFPNEITEEKLRTMKKELEESRENYEKALAKTRQLQEEYTKIQEKISEDGGRFKTMLYGFYGKKSRLILDFGMKPFKDRATKSKVPADV